MLGLMLRKRVAELAGISQAELEERFELKANRRAPGVPIRAARPGNDPYAKLLARVLAEPGLLSELKQVALPEPTSATPASVALFELLGEEAGPQAPANPEPSAGALIEVLRLRGHEATLQRLLPEVQLLQNFGREALAVEVRQHVQKLHDQARTEQAKEAVAGLSPGELSDEARAKVVEALAARKAVQQH
jgi:hypothetical protein